jgi:hypothetical protein
MLGILDGTGYEKNGAGLGAAVHYLAKSMRRAYADRNEYVGDPDFVKVPIGGLLDPAYLARLRASIDPERATPSDSVRPGKPRARTDGDDALLVVDAKATPWPSPTRSTAVRQRHHGAGSRLPAQQRDGRLRRQARYAEHVRPGAGRDERDSARQAAALVDDADDCPEETASCS